MVAPFLPQELKARGIKLDIYGYIFGIYSVAFIIFSPIIGELLRKYKRRKLVFMIGLVCMALSMVAYAIVPKFVSNKKVLIFFFLLFRFLQGFSSTAIQTTCFSIVTVVYHPCNQTKVMGLVITAESIGLTTAPIIGSFLYGLGGYEIPFYVIGVMFGICALIALIMIPKSVDMDQTDHEV